MKQRILTTTWGTPDRGIERPAGARIWAVLAAAAAVLAGGCERLRSSEELVRAAPQQVETGSRKFEPHENCPEEPGVNGAVLRELSEGAAPASPQPRPEGMGSLEGLVDVQVFGVTVRGLHPELRNRLLEAERDLKAVESPGAGEPGRWGVQTISGYRPGSRAHSQGLAIDINYHGNPYLMHEVGEEELDRQLAPVYHRIARLMLDRASVIPTGITNWPPSPERRMRLFQRLEEENRAMIAYFQLMRDQPAIERHLQAMARPTPPALREAFSLEGEEVTPEALQRQMMQDYVTLAGRPGPAVAGMSYPQPEPPAQGERPFVGDPRYRAPERGFLNLPAELVRALGEVGLMWGGTDMADASGDLMHFYLPASVVEAEADTRAPEAPRQVVVPLTPERIHQAKFGEPALPGRRPQPLLVKLQILLDRAHLSPGVIDGYGGENTRTALRTFQSENGLTGTGTLDRQTWDALVRHGGNEPVLMTYTISEEDVKGPFNSRIPTEMADKAKLEHLSYTSPAELLAEKFHMDQDLLAALNSGVNFSEAGTRITVANVRSSPPFGEVETLVVDRTIPAVKAYASGGRLLAFYPATVGSDEFPTPSGNLKVTGVAKHPEFTYSGDLEYADLKKGEVLKIPSGPNNPVGVVWIGLSKEGYGIHGSPEPSKVGKQASHGCVRLTNWDAQELAGMVRAGVPVRFAR